MQRGSESEGGPWCPSQSTGRRRLIPRFPSLASLFARYASACILHPSSHAARCRIRKLLLRISTDSPSISPTIAPCYSLRAGRREAAQPLVIGILVHSPSLSKLAGLGLACSPCKNLVFKGGLNPTLAALFHFAKSGSKIRVPKAHFRVRFDDAHTVETRKQSSSACASVPFGAGGVIISSRRGEVGGNSAPASGAS